MFNFFVFWLFSGVLLLFNILPCFKRKEFSPAASALSCIDLDLVSAKSAQFETYQTKFCRSAMPVYKEFRVVSPFTFEDYHRGTKPIICKPKKNHKSTSLFPPFIGIFFCFPLSNETTSFESIIGMNSKSNRIQCIWFFQKAEIKIFVFFVFAKISKIENSKWLPPCFHLQSFISQFVCFLLGAKYSAAKTCLENTNGKDGIELLESKMVEHMGQMMKYEKKVYYLQGKMPRVWYEFFFHYFIHSLKKFFSFFFSPLSVDYCNSSSNCISIAWRILGCISKLYKNSCHKS